MNAYDLNQLIQHYGTKTALANALGIRPQAVYQWEKVPPRRALEIEKINQGAFHHRTGRTFNRSGSRQRPATNSYPESREPPCQQPSKPHAAVGIVIILQ